MKSAVWEKWEAGLGGVEIKKMKAQKRKEKIQYEIMHGEKTVAWIDTTGHCGIFQRTFMPYHLFLDENEEDIDTLVNNITNFYYWCATRVLTLDRKYAKEILNSIGVLQAVTDKDRAEIALSYHCLCLTDIYWVKRQEEEVSFNEINIYDHHLDNAFVDVSLRGRQMRVQNQSLVRDLSTNGCFPKAWVRTETGFCLFKDGDIQAAEKAVENIGLNQIDEIKAEWFLGKEKLYEMLKKRLGILKLKEKWDQ